MFSSSTRTLVLSSSVWSLLLTLQITLLMIAEWNLTPVKRPALRFRQCGHLACVPRDNPSMRKQSAFNTEASRPTWDLWLTRPRRRPVSSALCWHRFWFSAITMALNRCYVDTLFWTVSHVYSSSRFCDKCAIFQGRNHTRRWLLNSCQVRRSLSLFFWCCHSYVYLLHYFHPNIPFL